MIILSLMLVVVFVVALIYAIFGYAIEISTEGMERLLAAFVAEFIIESFYYFYFVFSLVRSMQ